MVPALRSRMVDQAKKSPLNRGFEYGAGTTNRTRDLLITSQLLYQLSYAGMIIFRCDRSGR